MHRYFLFTRKTASRANAPASCSNNFAVKPQEENIYEQLLSRGYSKQDIHSSMYKYMLLQIQHNKATGYQNTSLHKKPSLCSKKTHFLKSLISAVVSFIKTQFAKKPKNPV